MSRVIDFCCEHPWVVWTGIILAYVASFAVIWSVL